MGPAALSTDPYEPWSTDLVSLMRSDQNKVLDEPWFGRLDELDHFSESDLIFGQID